MYADDFNGKQDKFCTIEDTTNHYLILNFNKDGYVQTNLNVNYPIIKDTSSFDEIRIDSKNFTISNIAVGGVKFESGSNTGDPLKIITGVMTDTIIPTIKFSPNINTTESTGVVKLTGIANGVNYYDAVNAGQLNQKIDKQETKQYVGQDSQEHAQIDSTEIITAQAGTWVTDGWDGDATTGFTHTSGNTSILKYPITGNDYTSEGILYDITFNCSVAPTVDNIMVRIGNSDLFNLYGQEEPLNVGVKSKGSTDGTIYLEFIPSSAFTGTISNIEVHKITGTYVGKYKIADNGLATSFEVRAGNHNKYNAYIGVDSGSYNTTGNGNAGFGYKSLANNTSGFWNTGIGFEALQFVNAGSRNIGIGAYAGRKIQTGQRNVAIGTHSFRENTTGNFNIAIGADSQLNGKSGDGNISIGVSSLYYIDGGNENIAIGHGAIAGNNTENKGNYNIALGYFSLPSGSNTSNNVAIGYNAGYGINSGNNNVMIGTSAGRNGSSQVVIGANSGLYLQAASSENVILGYYTGNTLKANKNCILIGSRVDGEATGDYQLNIGNLIKGSMKSADKYVNIDGSLYIGDISNEPIGKFSCLSSQALYFFAGNNGPEVQMNFTAHSGVTPVRLVFSSVVQHSDVGHYNVILSGLATPTDNQDAANKKYVDDKIAELTAKIEALSK